MVRNDIGELIGVGSIPIVYITVLNAEIRGFWEALIWIVESTLGCHIVFEGDVLDVLEVLRHSASHYHHPLLQDARLL